VMIVCVYVYKEFFHGFVFLYSDCGGTMSRHKIID
jgi:hypothetical protein